MSRVFLARETALDRLVVIKVLPADSMGGVNVERFRREIQVAARVQQANIVPVLAAGEVDGVPYYVMPFVEGESLRAHLTAHGALPMAEVISLARDMARALAAAHALGVVHRDIKPENVLLSGGAAVITDFGIAKALRAARGRDDEVARGETLTALGTSLGTPAYMAPEQAAGDPSTDHRADLYAFGAVVYEMLAGRPVFEGSAHELVAAHIGRPPAPIATRRRDTPPALAALVMQCLEKDPAARPASADAVLVALASATHAPVARRGRLQSAAMYVAACVVAAVAIRFALTGIGLPHWVLPTALALMALGLPAVLMLQAKYAIRGGLGAVGALSLAVAGYMTLRALGIGPVGSLFAAGVMKANDYVVVSDFRSVHADSALGAMVAEAVRTGLSQSTAIAVVPRAMVDTALARMGKDPRAPLDLATARDAAARDGAKAVVDGDVAGVASGYVVSLRLVAADDGRELASFHAAASNAQGLIEAADALVRDLRAKIGESLRSVNAMPELYDLTTSSIDALRAYTLAERASSAGDIEAATAHYREATRLDSNFAIAWLSLSDMLFIERFQAASDSAQYRAYVLRDRLSRWERLAITGAYLGVPTQRDPVAATRAFQEMIDEGDSSTLGQLATLLLNQRAYARAEPLFRAELGSDATPDPQTRLNLVAVLFNEGKVQDAQAQFDTTRRDAPHYPVVARWATELAYQRGDLARTVQLADSLRTSSAAGARTWGANRMADLALLHGQLAKFQQFKREALTTAAARGDLSARRGGAITFAYVDAWMTPTPERGAVRLDSALGRMPLDTSDDDAYYTVASTYALAGRVDRARAVLAQYDRMPMDSIDRRLSEPGRHRVLGEIALAEKQWALAIREMRRSDSTAAGVPAGTCRICVYGWLGHAYDVAGMADSAIAAYETYLRTPLLMRGVSANASDGADPFMMGPVYRRLGELYDRKGDRAHAIDYYSRFADLWKDADPQFQPWVTAARGRAQALKSGG